MITMSGYITDLYNNSNKTSVVNNNTTYQYDTSDNLMQDIAKNIANPIPVNIIDLNVLFITSTSILNFIFYAIILLFLYLCKI